MNLEFHIGNKDNPMIRVNNGNLRDWIISALVFVVTTTAWKLFTH